MKKKQKRDMESVFGEQVAGSLRRFEARNHEMLKIRIMSMIFDVEFPEGSSSEQD